MLSFKLWLEIVELRKPSGKVHKRNITKDPGTNVARRIIQYDYTTKLGNVIKLQFEPKGDNDYSIIFYVNDTLYDFAPMLDADSKPEKKGRDAEILPSIFFLIKTKADKLGATTLTFHSHASNRDTRTIRGLDTEAPKKQALLSLDNFQKQIQSYQVKMVEPNHGVWQKIGKPSPPSRPDVDQAAWFTWISKLKAAINTNQNLEEYIDHLLNTQGNQRLPIDLSQIISSLKNLNNAQASNTERGYARTINRRTAIYTRILNRYFANDWNIKISGDNFTLTRLS